MARRFWIALALIISASPVSAGPRLLGSDAAPPLPAWVGFCERLPAECATDTSEPETITLTQEVKTLLSLTNLAVNRSLRPLTDEAHWGIVDLWDYPSDGSGDCEDYQLLKRKILVESGLPRRALLMTVVTDEKGEGHAVLTVRTDRGDFILDNKTNEVLEWFETSYTFIKRESDRQQGWVFLTPEPSTTLVALASE